MSTVDNLHWNYIVSNSTITFFEDSMQQMEAFGETVKNATKAIKDMAEVMPVEPRKCVECERTLTETDLTSLFCNRCAIRELVHAPVIKEYDEEECVDRYGWYSGQIERMHIMYGFREDELANEDCTCESCFRFVMGEFGYLYGQFKVHFGSFKNGLPVDGFAASHVNRIVYDGIYQGDCSICNKDSNHLYHHKERFV